MSYVDLVTGEIRYQFNRCSCGEMPRMIVLPTAAGGAFYAVACHNCNTFTPTVYRSADEAEKVWNEMVKGERNG